MTIIQINEAGLDFNNFITDGRYQCSGEVLNSPPWYPGAGYGHFFVDVYRRNDDWIVQVAHAANYIGSFIRHCISGTWHDWEKIATTTSPQQFDLPLAEGWQIKNYAKYWVNQAGEVSLFFRLGKSNGDTTQGVISTLPTGFRPAVPVHAAAISYPSYHPALLVVGTDGTITIFCDSTESGPEGSFCGSASFVAYD